jgi:hypothetical protein
MIAFVLISLAAVYAYPTNEVAPPSETEQRLKANAIMVGVGAGSGALVGGWRGAALGAGIGLATQEVSRLWMKHKLPKVQAEQMTNLNNDVDGEDPLKKPLISQKDQFQLGSDGISAASGAAFGFMAGGPFGAVVGAAASVAIGEGITAGLEHKERKDAEKLEREEADKVANGNTDDNKDGKDNKDDKDVNEKEMVLVRDKNGDLMYVPGP